MIFLSLFFPTRNCWTSDCFNAAGSSATRSTPSDPLSATTTYSAREDDPWKYVWLEFDGLRVAEYLNEAGLSAAHPVYQPKTAAQAEQVRDVMLHIAGHSKASPLQLIGHLCLFLDALIQSSSTRREPRETQLRDFYIQEAVSYMERNYQRELTVEEIAGACQLNRSYFKGVSAPGIPDPPAFG